MPKDIFDTSNALLIGLNNWALKAEIFQARWTFHSFRLWLKAAFCDKMHFRKLWQIRYAASRRKSINMQWLVEHGITRKNICIEHSKMRKEKKMNAHYYGASLVKQQRVSLTTAQLLHFVSATSQDVRRIQFFKPHSTHLLNWK